MTGNGTLRHPLVVHGSRGKRIVSFNTGMMQSTEDQSKIECFEEFSQGPCRNNHIYIYDWESLTGKLFLFQTPYLGHTVSHNDLNNKFKAKDYPRVKEDPLPLGI